jgi:hypothetical protein
MTMSKILRRLVLVFALAALCLPAQAQRFVKVFDNIPALLAANPNDVNTNAFVAGFSTIADGGGGFYTWKAGSTATTNADLSILKANNYSTGRWYRFNGFIIAGGTNQFDTIYVTNLYVTNLTVTSTNTYITNFFFNNTYITNISQGDNWVAEGLTQTNSDLAGIGRTWKLIATNSVEVGQPGDTPLIELTSPNAAYTNVMSLDSSGVFTMTNNGVLLLSVDPNGGVEAISQFANGYFAATSPFGSQGRLSANGSLLLDSISGLGGSVSLSPGAPTNNTPFTLVDNNDLGHGSILVIGSGGGTTFTLYADGPILVENTGVTNFYISTPSGYTGTGTNYLSDNGTYHAVDTLTDGTDFIEVIGGKAYFSAGLDLGSDSSPFGPVDDIQMEGTLNVFGSGVGTANYEKFLIDHQGSSGVVLDSVAGGSGTARDILFRIGGQGKVKITSGALVPASSADYNLGATTTANSFWNDVFSKGIYYTYGFGEGTADTESGAFYHNGSSALITESLSAGSGVARDFYWKSNGVTVDKLALNSGYTGAGTKFKSDDGTYKSAGGGGVNPSTNVFPYNNSGSFADSPLSVASGGLLFTFPALGASWGGSGIFNLKNDTVATVPDPDQNSPALVFEGRHYLAGSDTQYQYLIGNQFNDAYGRMFIERFRNGIDGSPVRIFSLEGNSGWTGAGTLFLSDDGTYHAVDTVNPTSTRIPYNNSGFFDDSPIQVADAAAATIIVAGTLPELFLSHSGNYLDLQGGDIPYIVLQTGGVHISHLMPHQNSVTIPSYLLNTTTTRPNGDPVLSIQNNGADYLSASPTSTAGETILSVYDVTAAAFRRVKSSTIGSLPVGSKVLYIDP